MERLKTLVLLAVVPLVGACGVVPFYEETAYTPEPLYCYRSLGMSTSSVDCYRTPDYRDERRLVNYVGPDPSRYERPAPALPPELSAPPPVDFYVRDPEPIPEPAPPRTRK